MPPCVVPVAQRISNADVDHVYYVHPSEGPNTFSITPQLNGPNYISWSRSIKRALGAKKKLVFIDGFIGVLDLAYLNRIAWERCNCLVHSWILNFVNALIAQTIVFLENDLDVWNDLKERFAKTDHICVSNLRVEINNLNQGSKSILDYFTVSCHEKYPSTSHDRNTTKSPPKFIYFKENGKYR